MNWIELDDVGQGLYELMVNRKRQRILVEEWEKEHVEELMSPFTNADFSNEYCRLVAIGACRIARATPIGA